MAETERHTDNPCDWSMNMRNRYCLAPLVLCLTACGEPDVLDVGDEKGQLGQALSDYAAAWDGYAQAFAFAGDEQDRVRLTIDQDGGGTIRFGEEELFAPATDPDGFYPSTYPHEYDREAFEPTSYPEARSGVEYPISAHVEDARLRFEFNPLHFMDSWCKLQPGSPLPGWTCGSATWLATDVEDHVECSYRDEDGVFQPLSCSRAAQCLSCTCDELACRARTDDVVRFDGVLSDEGRTLTGTMLLPTSRDNRITVVMTQ